jgi:ethanolamine utilization protein EutN
VFLGKVVGTVWSTKKVKNLEGLRFLIVHPFDLDKEPTKNVVIVADTLGAGVGEVVMCAYGRAARLAVNNEDASIEAAVVGIVDSLDISAEALENLGTIANALKSVKRDESSRNKP